MLPLRAPEAPVADLAALKRQTAARDPAATAAVAQEFEKLFGEMMVGAMRQASIGDSLFPQENGLYRQLYDKEIVRQMSQSGGLGIADLMMKQMAPSGLDDDALATRTLKFTPRHASAAAAIAAMRTVADEGAVPSSPLDASCGAPAPKASIPLPNHPAGSYRLLRAPLPPVPAAPSATRTLQAMGATTVQPADDAVAASGATDPRHQFVAKIWPHAQKAAESLGVPVEIVVAQAALETGWGKSTLASRDNNLFGVKATGGWQGARANYATQEFVAGKAVTEHAQFRGYDSVAGSFEDYVALLNNPRYAAARASGGDASRFAHALQRAGYATDPQYANKLLAIARGDTLRDAMQFVPGGTRATTIDAGDAAGAPQLARGP